MNVFMNAELKTVLSGHVFLLLTKRFVVKKVENH